MREFAFEIRMHTKRIPKKLSTQKLYCVISHNNVCYSSMTYDKRESDKRDTSAMKVLQIYQYLH